MGRKKSHPVRSVGLSEVENSNGVNSEKKLESGKNSEVANAANSQEDPGLEGAFYINIDQSQWASDEHFDVAEITLIDLKFADEIINNGLILDGQKDSSFSLRFRLNSASGGSFRLGHWPLLSADSVFLECFASEDSSSTDLRKSAVIFSAAFDGPDEGVSGLVHLVSRKYLALRLVWEAGTLVTIPSLRVRIEILRNAFDACASLMEIARQPWRKSMMHVMSWLRPEVTTSEAIYRVDPAVIKVPDADIERNATSKDHSGFNVAVFYEAIKPSKEEPMLEDELPDLLPKLRPYQRRAIYWMVRREKGVTKSAGMNTQVQLCAPFCVPVVFLEGDYRMFYNPFSGNVALDQELHPSYVSGGILADEMGLGKTVELLACIFANRKPPLEDVIISDHDSQDIGGHIKRQKQERVECVCGAASESSKYKGIWVQCDICDAWQHADCVGFSPKNRSLVSHEVNKRRDFETVSSKKSRSNNSRKHRGNIIQTSEAYICSLCSELIEAANTTIYTGATLIVCPGSILAQWQAELIRHTRPGSLKVGVYEGARNLASSATLRTYMTELASYDIILTTYDVLKEDLSHDADRHDGDRRFMRFQKRYPVVPTILTRIYWWRLCLDEAQMVECNTGSVTEMAMRLRAQHRWCITGTPIQLKLDDIYGLLHFLRANPFDVYRWWVEVIRDPYERRDTVAMEFIYKFFKQIMWRSSKVHVAEELQLPPQEESVSWLTFSPVEEHFYQKQHQTCVTCAQEIITSLKGSDASFDRFLCHSEVAKLLYPLLKLRQACCHPQVGSSGLCSLQHSPLTMEEILEVLIGKAKTEGEEALRRIVVAVNGLAAITIIEQDNARALSLYKEALALAGENCNNFRLDPLLSLHIHHNLAEVLPKTSEFLQLCPCRGKHTSENREEKKRKAPIVGKFDQHYVKRKKIVHGNKPVSSTNESHLASSEKEHDRTSYLSTGMSDDPEKGTEDDSHHQLVSQCYADDCLRETCEDIKRKFLSLFITRLSWAQKEFKSSHEQVGVISRELKNQSMCWWLHALNLIEQNESSSKELIQKIDQSVSKAVNSSRQSKVSSRFGSISSLKYIIQTGLDSLETSRQAVLERLLEIDRQMEKPNDDDIERVRYCPICSDGDGALCVPCELNELFQAYEARLFLLRQANSGAVIASVEEALDLQKQKSELFRFFRDSKSTIDSDNGDDTNKRRHVRANVQVSRNPSELEIILGVIKSYSKGKLGKQGVASARKHLVLFEAMRREIAQAKSLSVAQAQLLRAHDEIKWATSRLRLRETESEPTAVNVLSKEELVPSSLQFSSDKLLALSSLGRIKGQIRYLKGLVLSKQTTEQECPNILSGPQASANLTNSSLAGEENEGPCKTDDEPCPICHEELCSQRMVFQCGHVICCKCCLQMTEQAAVQFGRSQHKWIICPTCRQRTDLDDIAYVAEKQRKDPDQSMPNAFQAQSSSEMSILVQGSYGTKIEAVTRRILWIKSTDERAKILVFSSWNDVLDVLEHALDANGVTHVRMKGGRKSQAAIAQFKGQTSNLEAIGKSKGELSRSKPIQVLLMLILNGANGLNILEAEHVILVEPLLNPATEEQAISRVHRIGQERKTFVHRFVVKNTVEESIYRINRSRATNSFSGTKSKNDYLPELTLRDVECLFPSTMSAAYDEDVPTGSLNRLPPAVAAGLAAERRLLEGRNNST